MFNSFLNVFLNSIVMLLYYQYYSFSFIYFVILSFPCFIILVLSYSLSYHCFKWVFLCYHLASFLVLSYFAIYFGHFFISFLSHPFIRVALFKVSLCTYFAVRFKLTDIEWFNAILLFNHYINDISMITLFDH